jgi:hypothetical protein
MLFEITFTTGCIAVLAMLYLSHGTEKTKPVAATVFITSFAVATATPLIIGLDLFLKLGQAGFLVRGPLLGVAGASCCLTATHVTIMASKQRELNRRRLRLPPELTP